MKKIILTILICILASSVYAATYEITTPGNNVGIGTTTPAYTLTVNGSGGFLGVGNVGINTLNPGQQLDVAGITRTIGFVDTLNPGTGYVMTSNASGVGSWNSTMNIIGSDVGVNNASPTQALDVSGTVRGTQLDVEGTLVIVHDKTGGTCTSITTQGGTITGAVVTCQ